MKKNLLKRSVPGFSLIEMSIVLVIIGIITGAIFKGQELLDSAKVRSVAQDFQQYSLAVSSYQEMYHALPGDDSKASIHFSGTTSGDGNGQITGTEADLFWQHLHKASIVSSNKSPTSKFGGQYVIVFQPFPEMSGHWLMLAKEGEAGLLTPKQALSLKHKIDQEDITNPNQGQLVIKDGAGASGRCVRNGHINLENKSPDCRVYYRF
ncbi:MAG: type II secretion system protein [Pseudomonadota bacterium]|jgi:prepilin-type N-terminal cleavage/methylation domain-containing protein|nr:prepilin-type N-terminal cleavage/methylation domain-containing protein [Alphaproteobacteria bacterium]